MVPMYMGEDHSIYFLKVQIQLMHILEKYGRIAARIKEDLILRENDKAGKAPGGRQGLFQCVVVIDDQELIGRSSHGVPPSVNGLK
jgi:hypothetical protein